MNVGAALVVVPVPLHALLDPHSVHLLAPHLVEEARRSILRLLPRRTCSIPVSSICPLSLLQSLPLEFLLAGNNHTHSIPHEPLEWTRSQGFALSSVYCTINRDGIRAHQNASLSMVCVTSNGARLATEHQHTAIYST